LGIDFKKIISEEPRIYFQNFDELNARKSSAILT